MVAAHGLSAGKHNHKTEHPLSSAYVCLPQLACICAPTAPALRNSLPAGVPDKSEQPAKTTRIRVERQTHLPATREEAWAALRQLVPPREWQEASGVFAALESIYRSAQHSLALSPAGLLFKLSKCLPQAGLSKELSSSAYGFLLHPRLQSLCLNLHNFGKMQSDVWSHKPMFGANATLPSLLCLALMTWPEPGCGTCRVEYQLVGEATLQTLRAANETLIELPKAEEPGRRRRRKRRQDAGAAAEPSAAPSLPGQSSSNGAGPPQEAAPEAAGAAHAAEGAAGEQRAEPIALHSGNGASLPQREELEQPPPPPLPVGLPAEDAMTAAEAAQQARGTQPHPLLISH